MQFTITVPATVELTIEIDAPNKKEALKLFNEGEFKVIEEDVYDYDFDYIEDLNEV